MKVFRLYLSDRQRRFLDEEARELDISVAEIIRRVLDKHIDEQRSAQIGSRGLPLKQQPTVVQEPHGRRMR